MIKDRFLAVILPENAPSDDLARIVEAAGRRMRPALIHPMLYVFGDTGVPIEEQAALVVGPHFESGPRRASRSGSTRDVAQEAHRNHDFWGACVSFHVDEAHALVEVVRDMSGAAPCLYTRRWGAVWLFSDIETASEFDLSSDEVDWTALAHFLAYPHLRTGKTCLVGVEELRPGMRLKARKGGQLSVDCCWTPWEDADQRNFIRSYDEAVECLRTTVLDCIKKWASLPGPHLLELSGGLDSSIIAACLRAQDDDFACVTFATDDASGDERVYARIVASKLGVPLAEHRLDPARAEFAPAQGRRTPFPNAMPWHRLIDDAVARAVEQSSAATVFSGGGGDNVFSFLTTAAPAADALRASGPGAAFVRSTADLAKLYRTHVWRVAGHAARKAFWAKSHLWPRSEHYLQRSALPGEPMPHPWFVSVPAALPGKCEQAASIACAANASDGIERNLPAPLRYPLLSRPLIECCLQIPSWMWVRGGRNRAVARDAFADMLPQETACRRSKGDLTGLAASIYRHKKAEILALLMDGRLAERGIIDREAVAARIESSAPFRDASFTQLVTLASVEAWIQSSRA